MPGFSQQVQRTPMRLPPRFVQTFTIAAPLATHWRPVSCEQAGCAGYDPKCKRCTEGWDTVLDLRAAEGARTAAHIRQASGRAFREIKGPEGVVIFRFEGHQRCFADHAPHKHVARADRQERFLVTGGDWRGNPARFRREHTRPALWQEEFAENQDQIARARARG